MHRLVSPFDPPNMPSFQQRITPRPSLIPHKERITNVLLSASEYSQPELTLNFHKRMTTSETSMQHCTKMSKQTYAGHGSLMKENPTPSTYGSATLAASPPFTETTTRMSIARSLVASASSFYRLWQCLVSTRRCCSLRLMAYVALCNSSDTADMRPNSAIWT